LTAPLRIAVIGGGIGGLPFTAGPKVRIRLPPAGSQQRTWTFADAEARRLARPPSVGPAWAVISHRLLPCCSARNFWSSAFGLGLPAGDVSRASTGDSIEVIFTGRIDVEDNGSEGTGAFQHFDKSGKLVDWGNFKARRLISFMDYGSDDGVG